LMAEYGDLLGSDFVLAAQLDRCELNE
jgi:hypothetical protein